MIVKDVAQAFSRNWLRALGAIIATIAGSVAVAFFVLDLLGFHGGPYLGILAFAVSPLGRVTRTATRPSSTMWKVSDLSPSLTRLSRRA